MNVNCPKFKNHLTRWFERNKRDLPWRAKGNPYRIFVVEVMLQQTQIKTVIPYYERWLKTFPTIEIFAKAPIDRVLKLWEGLGYYTRARNLHKAAQIIVRDFKGVVPSNPETLQTLPGIGKYTAGAVASIAYQKPVPLVDGNVARVFSRVFNIKQEISKPETQKKLYEIAESLVPGGQSPACPRPVPGLSPGIFNQALMELGSLICIPDAPKCTICPVKTLCIAYKKGDPSRLPVKSKGVRVKKIEMVVGLLERDGKLLVRRREARGIWGGLWELPSVVRMNGISRTEILKQEFKDTLGLSVSIQKKMHPMEHRFTHRLARIHPFELSVRVKRAQCQKGTGHTRNPGDLSLFGKKGDYPHFAARWATRKQLKKLSFPVPHQKILRDIIERSSNGCH